MSKPGRVPTLAEWMAEYLDVLYERLVLSEKMAPRTLNDYQSKTKNWINPLLGGQREERVFNGWGGMTVDESGEAVVDVEATLD